MVAGDSTVEVFLEEEPFEVAISTISMQILQEVVPELGKEEGRHCRTVNSLITWKEESCKKEFDAMKKRMKEGGSRLRKQVGTVTKLLTRQHQLKVVLVAAMVSEMLRRATVEAGKERRFLDFAQALVRQKTSRFKKLVSLVESEYVPVKWRTDEDYLELEGFLAQDGGVAEEGVLTAAWSCMRAGIHVVNMLCKCEEAEKNWKPIFVVFSITNEERKVKLKHKCHMQATKKIQEAAEAFREDLKQLKAVLKEVKSLDKMPDDAELLA